MTDTKQQAKRSAVFVQTVLTLSVLLVAGAGILGYRFYLARGIEGSIQAIEDAGYPVTQEQLEESYVYPEGANAADFLALARRAYDVRRGDGVWLRAFSHEGIALTREPLRETRLERLVKSLEKRETSLELLYKAAQTEGCRYEDVPYGRRLDSEDRDHLLGGLRGATFLILEGVLHAEQQEPGLALRPLLAALRITDTFRSEPSMLGHHARLFCIYRFSHALQWMLSRTSFEAPLLEALRRPLAEAEDPQAVERAYAALRVLGTSLYRAQDGRQVEAALNLRNRYPFLGRVYRPLGLLEMDMTYFLDKMGRLIAVSRLPWPERLAPFKDLARELRKTPTYLLGSKGFFNAMPHGIVEDLELVALTRTTRTALSVELFRIEEGRLPNTLEELVPSFLNEIPQDPYDGNPLRYKRQEEGYTVYSIGVNGTDDEGEGFQLNEVLQSSLRGIVQTPGTPTINVFGYDTTFEVLR